MNRSAQAFCQRYGPWALITGASNGIGAAMAADLAGRRLDLVLVARSGDRLEAHAQSLREAHPIKVTVVTADLGTAAGVETVLNEVDTKEIGLYAGCAGFGTAGPFVGNDAAVELEMIDVNCRALTALAHPLAQAMRARRRGGLILMSSIVAFQGVANSANYAATKAYVQTLAEGLAAELAPFGVDVLASAPGPVDTGFAARADMRLGAAANAKTVASATLEALGRTTTVRPGAQAKLLGYGLSTLPRRLRSRIMGQIMTGMTEHHHGQKEASKP